MYGAGTGALMRLGRGVTVAAQTAAVAERHASRGGGWTIAPLSDLEWHDFAGAVEFDNGDAPLLAVHEDGSEICFDCDYVGSWPVEGEREYESFDQIDYHGTDAEKQALARAFVDYLNARGN